MWKGFKKSQKTGAKAMPKKYVVVDTEFHHIPWEAAKKAKDLPDGDLKFKNIVQKPDIAYRKVFDRETCIRHMEESGSDYPWEMGRASDMKAYINAIKRFDIPEADRIKILGGNMLKLFKVKV